MASREEVQEGELDHKNGRHGCTRLRLRNQNNEPLQHFRGGIVSSNPKSITDSHNAGPLNEVIRFKVKVKESEVTQFCPTLCDPMDCSLPGSSVHGKSTGMGCHFLLQRIFPTLGSNPGLPHCRQMLYHLSHQGSQIQGKLNLKELKLNKMKDYFLSY